MNSFRDSGLMICDAQVHAPDVPHAGRVGGLSYEGLIAEMDGAGVHRCIVVPPAAPGPDTSANNAVALDLAARKPDRLAVMGRFDLTTPDNAHLLPEWKKAPGMLGIRVSFILEANKHLLGQEAIEWFWDGAEAAAIPVMVLVPNHRVDEIGRVAARHPGLNLTVDHFGFTPYEMYEDLMTAVEPVIGLALYPNVSVKATALPDSVTEPYPFKSLHDPIRAVVEAMGPQRVFWGSDLTRLKCPYEQCVDLFAKELPFLTAEDKEWIMGRGVMEWLNWNPVQES